MLRRMSILAATALSLAGGCVVPLPSAAAISASPALNLATLVKIGDTVRYGSYLVIKIGEGIYKINDPGVTTGKGGAWGVDSYLILGTTKAFLVDLGNNYITGYAPDLIAPRPNASAEFRAIIFGLIGRRSLIAAPTHAHPDHEGMTQALMNDRRVTLLMPAGEDPDALNKQFKITPSPYSSLAPGTEIQLGGGRSVKALQVRGHTNGSTVYLLAPDMYLFTGDSIGSGFGQAFSTADALKSFAGEATKLVSYLKTNLTPYQRYALKVFTGHSWQNKYAGWWSPKHEQEDIGYLDWRFVQDVALCASGILEGKWLVPGSGLQYVGKMEYTDAWPRAGGQAIMSYGTGTVITTLEAAYQAAGLPMPTQQTPSAPKSQ